MNFLCRKSRVFALFYFLIEAYAIEITSQKLIPGAVRGPAYYTHRVEAARDSGLWRLRITGLLNDNCRCKRSGYVTKVNGQEFRNWKALDYDTLTYDFLRSDNDMYVSSYIARAHGDFSLTLDVTEDFYRMDTPCTCFFGKYFPAPLEVQ